MSDLLFLSVMNLLYFVVIASLFLVYREFSAFGLFFFGSLDFTLTLRWLEIVTLPFVLV